MIMNTHDTNICRIIACRLKMKEIPKDTKTYATINHLLNRAFDFNEKRQFNMCAYMLSQVHPILFPNENNSYKG